MDNDKSRIDERENVTEQDATSQNQASATAKGAAQDDSASEAPSVTQAQAKEYLEGWQRARAEFANYKKRVERDMKDTYQNASGDVIKDVLPIIDDFDRALANTPNDLKDNTWVQGIAMIQRKMIKLLEDTGVTLVDPTGELFDPNVHQAIGMDDVADIPSGHITKTEQKGYVLGERMLRPALVRVNQ